MKHVKNALRVGLLLFLASCAAEGDKANEPVIEPDQNGNLVLVSIPEGSSPPPAVKEDAPVEKAGCTHIQYCTTPGTSNTVTCITNDQVCSNAARWNECHADAQAVCGRTIPMRFNPPIPCPIPGVC